MAILKTPSATSFDIGGRIYRHFLTAAALLASTCVITLDCTHWPWHLGGRGVISSCRHLKAAALSSRSDVIRIVFSLLMSPCLVCWISPTAVRKKVARVPQGRGLMYRCLRGQKSQGPLKMSWKMAHKAIVQKKKYVPKFLKQWYIGNFMTRVLLLCVVVCKRGGEVSLTRVQIPTDAVLCYRFWRQSVMMSLSPSQGQKRQWYSGEYIAAFKAVNPGLIPGRCSFVLQVLKTESYDEFESHSVTEVRWHSGEHSCLQSRYPRFSSRPMQFCVTGSEESYHESRSCY